MPPARQSLIRRQSLPRMGGYLARKGLAGDPESRIRTFLGCAAGRELRLNPHGTQRLVLISDGFTEEVWTSTLWLREQGVGVECFSASAMVGSAGLLLDVQRVVPEGAIRRPRLQAPSEEASSSARGLLREFAEFIDGFLRDVGAPRMSAARLVCDRSLEVGVGAPGVLLRASFGLTFVRFGLHLDRRARRQRVETLAPLIAQRDALEREAGVALDWAHGPEGLIEGVSQVRKLDMRDRKAWPGAAIWLAECAFRFERHVSARLPGLDRS